MRTVPTRRAKQEEGQSVINRSNNGRALGCRPEKACAADDGDGAARVFLYARREQSGDTNGTERDNLGCAR
jgi:hypothetical protein